MAPAKQNNKTMKKRTQPILIINFKTYEKATGNNALKLAKICDKVSKQTKIKIIRCL